MDDMKRHKTCAVYYVIRKNLFVFHTKISSLTIIVFLCAFNFLFTVKPANAACEGLTVKDIAKIQKAIGNIQNKRSRAVAHVHTEGTLPHSGIYDVSRLAEEDWQEMREIALLWDLNHKKNYSVVLSELMQSWAGIYQPNFNPIDETNLDAYIDAYNIAHNALTSSARAQSQHFIERLTKGYLQQMEYSYSLNDTRWSNNWNSHRVKLVVMGAGALNDQNLWRRGKEEFKSQISRNIYPDGSTVDFKERDALHYVVYDLEPLLQAALTAKGKGESWLDLKGKNGSSLETALDWLLPYALGEKSHQEFVNTRVRFDIIRRSAGLKGYSGVWDPHEAAKLYGLASLLDKKYISVAKILNRNTKDMAWHGMVCLYVR